ncbi:hypothetical protein WICPIJ_004425 [Wickerhamomyces pijperi]|uniref:Uncharacterized protein n=1 Tax=Wickerhamomyces pijperi TaxID=599730 RepID=A0A9P8Q806_WICPI|nr:hypothetical protein WICPIJ_004425 [Wickerhamomyces pijperi]
MVPVRSIFGVTLEDKSKTGPGSPTLNGVIVVSASNSSSELVLAYNVCDFTDEEEMEPPLILEVKELMREFDFLCVLNGGCFAVGIMVATVTATGDCVVDFGLAKVDVELCKAGTGSEKVGEL